MRQVLHGDLLCIPSVIPRSKIGGSHISNTARITTMPSRLLLPSQIVGQMCVYSTAATHRHVHRIMNGVGNKQTYHQCLYSSFMRLWLCTRVSCGFLAGIDTAAGRAERRTCLQCSTVSRASACARSTACSLTVNSSCSHIAVIVSSGSDMVG